MNTSTTDNENWYKTCENANINTFRSSQPIMNVIEAVPSSWGQKYFDVIKNSELAPSILEFQKNDDIGSPDKRPYDTFNLSATTLRYIHVLSNLIKLYGKMDNWKICEIGIGYGGQCRIIDSYCNLSSYTLIDLPPVLNMTKKYLDKFKIKNILNFMTPEIVESIEYDLIISNFAFSEMYRESQDYYLNKIILKAKHGFMLYNNILDHSVSYRAKDLLKIINNSKFTKDPLDMPFPDDIISW